MIVLHFKWSKFIKHCNKNLCIRKHAKNKYCGTVINSKVANYCCCRVLNVHSVIKDSESWGTGLVVICHFNSLSLMLSNLCKCLVSDKELVRVTLFSSCSCFGWIQPMLKLAVCWEKHYQIHETATRVWHDG